jgi:hypothetical protein
MKRNRLIWGLVLLVALTTIAVSVGTLDGHGQEPCTAQTRPTATPETRKFGDFGKHALVEYTVRGSLRLDEKRFQANQRYDKSDWVLTSPHPDDVEVGRFDDDDVPSELFPTKQSDLIIVGKIIDVTAHLSNDSQGVYSEFKILVDQILKNDLSQRDEQNRLVLADRPGGVVRYSNGQKVLYRNSQLHLPQVGGEYLFFLTKDQKSPNYRILTLFEFKDDKPVKLDSGGRFDEFSNVNRRQFVEKVSNRISESLKP